MLGSEKWTISCCISKQGCHSHQQLQPSSEPVSPQGTQEGEANLLCSSIQTADTLRRALRKGSSGCENRMLAPDRWGAPGRNDFRERGLLHLPLHRKAPNPFPQDIWFSLTIVFWCSDYLPFLTEFCVTWPLPSPGSSSLRITWDGVSCAWSPKSSHRIKQKSQLLGCASFLSQQEYCNFAPSFIV